MDNSDLKITLRNENKNFKKWPIPTWPRLENVQQKYSEISIYL